MFHWPPASIDDCDYGIAHANGSPFDHAGGDAAVAPHRVVAAGTEIPFQRAILEIGDVATNAKDRPLEDVTILSSRVIETPL